MSQWSDAELASALRALPTPEPPPVEALLARAFPEGARTTGAAPPFAFAAAALAAASLPVWLPASPEAHAWNEGVARRGVEVSTALLAHFTPEDS